MERHARIDVTGPAQVPDQSPLLISISTISALAASGIRGALATSHAGGRPTGCFRSARRRRGKRDGDTLRAIEHHDAPGFKVRIIPSRFLLGMASSLFSTVAASHAKADVPPVFIQPGPRLGVVVARLHCWNTHGTAAGDRGIDHHPQALACDVVDNVEQSEPTTGGRLVMDEVRAPALVEECQHRRRRPRAGGAPSFSPRATLKY